MQRRRELSDELINLYRTVGESTWSPSDLPPHLKPYIRQWLTDGRIIRIFRGRSVYESKYTLNSDLCHKIRVDIILRDNIGLYVAGQLSIYELAHNTGLEPKYLNRRLIQIQREEQGY